MHLSTMIFPTVFRALEDSGAGAGGGDTPPDAAAGTSTDTSAGDPPPSDSNPPPSGDARPEWLPERYQTPEDFARGYEEMRAKFHTKTDLLREEIRKELTDDVTQNYAKLAGVPETPDAYAYPEGWNAPGEDIDGAAREWAKKHNVSEAGFKELITEVWAKTMPDPQAELAKLGPDPEDRIATLNNWLAKTFPESQYKALERIMTTADGVMFLEGIATRLSSGGFAPPVDSQGKRVPLTREGIRTLQADPRFGQDAEYTAYVRNQWRRFSELPADQQV